MSAYGGGVVATAVVARKVRPEHVEAYRAWQSEIDAATSSSPGFIGTETIPPVPGIHDDWVIIFRFDSKENLSYWMQSERRRELLERGDRLLETPAEEHTMVGGRPAAHVVTVVASTTPRPGRETEFLAAEKALETAARCFDGFTGYELLEPAHDGGAWTSLYRFTEPRYADEWLTSHTRAKLLAELNQHIERNVVRKVPSAFGSWFSFNEVDGANTPNWKQSMTVLLMLYPTIMCISYLMTYLQDRGVPFFLRTFTSNILSTITLGFLLMPLATRALSFWLNPGVPTRITIRGTILVIVLYAVLLGFWALVTL
ncbi:hypothetical protein NJB18091_00680 [Mycobacterium marinum]|uniref:Conserved membrane protein n=2 Tax=Mycobacterium marinum TaxID=1781 RepID=B2HRX8_MYCMM|nr:antibiotic biosynthesis monooxygenase [Mycobacterium marinum]ACC41008.1 conserved membrane protein [Mycobacterium marinum M]RFZ64769.1 Antibiotic biosynthesis monooxygenase [Mycobacterium marinum]GJP27317.1 hypothetical protein NJB18091_00680 [Mycobacterium marinum]